MKRLVSKFVQNKQMVFLRTKKKKSEVANCCTRVWERKIGKGFVTGSGVRGRAQALRIVTRREPIVVLMCEGEGEKARSYCHFEDNATAISDGPVCPMSFVVDFAAR